MPDFAVTESDSRDGSACGRVAEWTRVYLRQAAAAGLVTAAAASTVALQIRFGGHITRENALLSLVIPLLWVAVLGLSGLYDRRFISAGSEEFRKVLNAGVSLTAGSAISCYAVNTELSRGYLVITMPGLIGVPV